MMKSELNTTGEDAPIMEIIGKSPRWILGWGNIMIFVFIIAIGIFTGVIKYPEKIVAHAVLSDPNSSKAITAPQSGRLIKLLIRNNSRVYKNQVIGYFESMGDYKEVDSLYRSLENVRVSIEQSEYHYMSTMLEKNYTQLGELQENYNAFILELSQFYNYVEGGTNQRKRKLLRAEIYKLQLTRQSLIERKQMRAQDFLLTQKTLDANKRLLDEKVISQQEYRELTSQLINKKIGFSEMDDAIFNNRSMEDERRKEIVEMDDQTVNKRISLLKTLRDLENAIKSWKRKVIVYAPVDGLLTYRDFLQENEPLKANETIAFVSPPCNMVYMKLQIPQADFGKIRIGQKVLLKFPAYRWQEYGTMTGHIEYISPIPTDSGYAARIALPGQLKTNTNKVIQYREGLIAQAEIVVIETTLLQKFYYSIIR